MLVQNINERDEILGVVWLSATEQAELTKYVDDVLATSGGRSEVPLYRNTFPLNLPWSQSFYLCCQDVCASCRGYVRVLTTLADTELHTKILPIRRGCLPTPPQH